MGLLVGIVVVPSQGSVPSNNVAVVYLSQNYSFHGGIAKFMKLFDIKIMLTSLKNPS